jgi:hypothetical protein
VPVDSIDPDPPNDPDPSDDPADESDDATVPATSRSRRALRLVLFVAAAVIAGRVALSSPPSGTGDTATSDEAGDAGAPAGDDDGGGGVTTTIVDDPDAPTRPDRPAIDLAAVPQPGDPPTEVARWWAAAYAGWVGAETGDDLADRLALASTAALADRLRAAPPPASYGEPDAVVGAATGPALPHEPGVQVLVTVETEGGLAAYQLDLVDTGAEGWRVDAVTVL